MNRELIAVIDEIGRQKGIDKARVIGAIESALQTAAKKRFGQAENIQVEIDGKTGEISVVSKKIIVDTVANPKAAIRNIQIADISWLWLVKLNTISTMA